MIGWDQKVLTRKPLLGINKKPPRRAILQWILEAWDALPTDAIKRSFKSCALNLPVDGSDDDIIHCFKDKQPCSSGKAILDAQLAILKEPDVNPFEYETTNSDVEEAYPPTLELIDSDHEGDTDIEID